MTKQEILQSIGGRICFLRKEKEIKGETMARHLNISKSAYCNIEQGKVDLKLSVLICICEILETSIFQLLGDSPAEVMDALEQNRMDISRQNRLIDVLVCRNEYLIDQLNCLQHNEAGLMNAV